MRAAVKQLVTEELKKLVEETPDNILCTFYHNAQGGLRSVSYNAVEQVLLDLLRKDIICEILAETIAKTFGAKAAVNRLLNELLTSYSFGVPIATFSRRKTDSIISYKGTVAPKAIETEQIEAVEKYNDTIA